MKNANIRFQEVATILREWKGSDAAEEPSPNEVAAEIDHVYQAFLTALPEKTLAVRDGQKDWERKVA